MVLAAYALPTQRPASWPGAATAASASGKLAPHKQAGGRIAQRQRARSNWKVNQGLWERKGLIGQYGSDFERTHAVHAIAATRSIWQAPSASCGRIVRRARNAPPPLPSPSPPRNTATMMQNV